MSNTTSNNDATGTSQVAEPRFRAEQAGVLVLIDANGKETSYDLTGLDLVRISAALALQKQFISDGEAQGGFFLSDEDDSRMVAGWNLQAMSAYNELDEAAFDGYIQTTDALKHANDGLIRMSELAAAMHVASLAPQGLAIFAAAFGGAENFADAFQQVNGFSVEEAMARKAAAA